MPELPEVETIRAGIAQVVVGCVVRECRVYCERLRLPIPVEALITGCVGKVVRGVERRGKYLLLSCGEGHILIHLGMSGSLMWVADEVPLRLHDHVVWEFGGGYQLRLRDPRRFGLVLWVEGDWRRHSLLSGLGPEPLGDGFTDDYLYWCARGRRVAVKNWLMDSKLVVGIGNIYANEILFLARLHPGLLIGELTAEQCVVLVESVRKVLQAAIAQGGTTLRDFRQSDGQLGYFVNQLRVYGRVGQPCLECGMVIQSFRQGQRSTFFCPRCQLL